MHAMRKNKRAKQQLVNELKNFDLTKALCRTDFDRDFIHSAIVHWYGSKEKFVDHVRGPLREELLAEGTLNIPLPYLLLVTIAAMCSSLNSVVAYWVGGASVDTVLSQLIGGTLALEFFWFLPITKFSIYLCDRFADPVWTSCCMDYMQTGAIFLCFFALYYAGDEMATAAQSSGLATTCAWCFFAWTVSWMFCFQGYVHIRRFTRLACSGC